MKRLFALITLFTVLFTVDAQVLQIGLMGDLAMLDDNSGNKDYLSLDGKSTQPDRSWSAGLKLKFSGPMGAGFDMAVKYTTEDLCYSWMRNEFGETMSSSIVSNSDKIQFVSVPLNVRYDLELPAVSNIIIPFAFAGPELNYTFDGFEWKQKDLGNKIEEYVKENTLNWNLNFGVGVLLGRHVEISYVYTMRMTEPLVLNEGLDDELKSRYGKKRNKIGLTIYF